MKILFTRFPLESRMGGAEVQTLSLMKGLKERGHEVRFLGSCPVLLKQCKKLVIGHSSLVIGPPPVTKWGVISFLWRKYKMRKLLHTRYAIRNTQYDAVFMLSLTEKILLTPFLVQQGIKVIWIEHDTVGRWLTWNPWLSTLKKLSKKVTTVCVSELSANIFRDLGYQTVVAIPNGAPPPPAPPPSRGRGARRAGRGLVVGCIARRSPEKGVDLLEKAIAQLDGVEFLFNETGSGGDIEEFYSKIDVLVLPSRKEDPFGLVVAEAMMRGIATICTDVCGISGYLTQEHDAIIVPAGDIDALRDALFMMYNDGIREKLGKNGRETAMEKFTVERMVESYISLL